MSYPKNIPIALGRGKGATIMDADGNIFIDFFGGAGALALGHCNQYVWDSVLEQGAKLTHSLDFPTEARLDLVEKIISLAPGRLRGDCRVLFGGPTGSDAVEAATKLVKANTGRFCMVSFSGGYHGMTAGALALTSDGRFRDRYLPLVPGVYFMPYAYCYRCPLGYSYPGCGVQCAQYLESTLNDPSSGVPKPAGIIIEPVQGEGGSIVPPREFLEEIDDIAKRGGIPLIADEIQAGVGRTGEMWGSQHSNISPDIVAMSKGMGGGFPLSAIAYAPELDAWDPCPHIGTFRGSVTAMAAGAATLRFIEESNILHHAKMIGEHMLKVLRSHQEETTSMGDVRGLGLMIGVELVKDKASKEPWPELASTVRREALGRGVIVEVGGHFRNVVRFLPPLVITKDLADKGVELFIEALLRSEGRTG